MARVPEDEAKNLPVPVWDKYQDIANRAENKKASHSAAECCREN
jgi:hypothetical protein